MCKTFWNATVRRLGMIAVMLLAASWAQGADHDPYQVVGKVTDQLVSAAREFNNGGDKAAYDKTVAEALEPVVAFDYIAKVVMGDYYQGASEAQREEFAAKFKSGLINSYAKGIATYADSDIEIQKPDEPLGDKRRVTVSQKVKHKGSSHTLSYTMGKNREGQWKLINLVLNGANLGSSFVSQFEQLAQKHDGDVAKVIAHWDARDG